MNTKVLYQPVSLQSVNDNSIVLRKCSDRAETMLKFCQEYFGESLKEKTFFDVGANYGYFLQFFKNHCAEVSGIETDEKNIKVAQMFYPEVAGNIRNIEFSVFYNSGKYNIVSFLSVLHHYIIGKEHSLDLEDYIDIADELTEDIMFFEMGQEHETRFQGALDGWNPDTIQEWILKNTTFNVCKPLMVDNDNVGKFHDVFGRTLFACYRNHTE